MIDNADVVELVQNAQQGDQDSLNQLAGLARDRIYPYIYRIVLHDALAQDIVQETIVEMVNILGKLNKKDRFWPWLYGIATNKIRRHIRSQNRQRAIAISNASDIDSHINPSQSKQEGLAHLVAQELKQIIVSCMRTIKPHYREVLTMRCYEDMEFSEIAQVMGRSEFATRILFFRAKKSLQKQLARNGLGKGALLTALVIFGKLTAPSEAAAAQISITAATTQVGLLAGLAATAASTAGVITMTTVVGVLTVAPLVNPVATDKSEFPNAVRNGNTSQICPFDIISQDGKEEIWYFLPDAHQETVMIRKILMNGSENQPACQWIQNERANYTYRRNTVHINNYHIRNQDGSVWILPTDESSLVDFISCVQGSEISLDPITNPVDDLLVIASRESTETQSHYQCTYHPNVLKEEFFQYIWPQSAQVIDHRDAMHQRGWTFFRITGEIFGVMVKGTGRIPFVYATGHEHSPWLHVKVANYLEIIDCSTGAEMNASGQAATACPAGSFFAGLSRPWMGLHTMDTVRRDAARQRIWFDTQYDDGDDKAQVVLKQKNSKLIYTIDMARDVVDRIEFRDSDDRQRGFLEFTYLQDICGLEEEFIEPVVRKKCRSKESDGILWLFSLSQEGLVN